MTALPGMWPFPKFLGPKFDEFWKPPKTTPNGSEKANTQPDKSPNQNVPGQQPEEPGQPNQPGSEGTPHGILDTLLGKSKKIIQPAEQLLDKGKDLIKPAEDLLHKDVIDPAKDLFGKGKDLINSIDLNDNKKDAQDGLNPALLQLHRGDVVQDPNKHQDGQPGANALEGQKVQPDKPPKGNPPQGGNMSLQQDAPQPGDEPKGSPPQ